MPSSVSGCCNWARGWAAIRSASTCWGVQPRAVLRSCAFGRRPWRRPQLGRGNAQLALALEHVAREPDRAGLLADGPADGLANPPVGIGNKFQAALRLKLVDRA